MPDLKNLVLLDSDSTNVIFCNPYYVNNIRKAKNKLTLNANRGPLINDQECDVLYLGTRQHNPNLIMNIISLADVRQKYPIIHNSRKENAFVAHLNNKNIKFKGLNNGLCARDLTKSTNKINKNIELINAV